MPSVHEEARMTELLKPVSSPLGTLYVPSGVPEGAVLFYTAREFDGVLRDGGAERVRTTMREVFGVDAPLSTCHQVHGTNVGRFNEASGWCELDSCDALWTSESPSAIGIKVADCLPVTLIDRPQRLAANIHAGWRGAAADIVSATLAETSLDAATSRVFLGPSIRVCCFEVGEEVVDAFTSTYGHASRHVDRTRGAKPHFDLAGFVRELLEKKGFPAGSIVDTEACTRCDERFHSYRRDAAKAGRNLAIVAQ